MPCMSESQCLPNMMISMLMAASVFSKSKISINLMLILLLEKTEASHDYLEILYTAILFTRQIMEMGYKLSTFLLLCSKARLHDESGLPNHRHLICAITPIIMI